VDEDTTGSKTERSVGPEIWRNTLSHIPTLFGRLAYIASLRDPHTGRYHHYGMERLFGNEAAELMLRQSHSEIFSRWLNCGLEEQKHDLEDYLSDTLAGGRPAEMNWSRFPDYLTFVPPEAGEVERRLYASDLEILLEILKVEDGAASPDPDASPPR